MALKAANLFQQQPENPVVSQIGIDLQLHRIAAMQHTLHQCRNRLRVNPMPPGYSGREAVLNRLVFFVDLLHILFY
ncbi:hypothetical protein D3C75_1351640 [compost metagenome]